MIKTFDGCGYSKTEELVSFTVELVKERQSPRKVFVSPLTWEWLRMEFNDKRGFSVLPLEQDRAALVVMIAGRQLTILVRPELGDSAYDFEGCK